VTHVTCRLTAKNRDRLRNPTLGDRVWASLFTDRQTDRQGQRAIESGGKEHTSWAAAMAAAAAAAAALW